MTGWSRPRASTLPAGVARGPRASWRMAVNAVGRPPGAFLADAAFRQAPEKDSTRRIAGLDRAQALAPACPDTRVVTVCDREGDSRDLLSRAQETPARDQGWTRRGSPALARAGDPGRKGAALPVRARRGSRRRVALASGGDADLRDHVLGTDPVGTRRIKVPACGGPNRRKGRTARLTLRCTPVDLLPPKDRKGAAPVRMIAVSALEETPRLKTGAGRCTGCCRPPRAPPTSRPPARFCAGTNCAGGSRASSTPWRSERASGIVASTRPTT